MVEAESKLLGHVFRGNLCKQCGGVRHPEKEANVAVVGDVWCAAAQPGAGWLQFLWAGSQPVPKKPAVSLLNKKTV